MTTPFSLRTLIFNGSGALDLESAPIVVLVGPNNAGKSRALQEIQQILSTEPGFSPSNSPLFVLDDLRLDKHMDVDAFRDWLRTNRYVWRDDRGNEYSKPLLFQMASLVDLGNQWGRLTESHLGSIWPFVVRQLFCGDRLTLIPTARRIDPTEQPDHPLHDLMRSDQLRHNLERHVYDAFHFHTILDGWGQNIVLRLSRTERQQDFEATSSDGFAPQDVLERIAAVPAVETQSDGVRSLVGMLLTVVTGKYPVVLLDEPEAFLHPPQARQAGRSLAELQREGQLVLATHSLDVLLGLIEANPEGVHIIRLTRANEKTSAHSLLPSKLWEVWNDPLLKFSRTLDGLFHEGVVICEGDTDSRFYSAVAANCGSLDGRDLMFTVAGGKARIPLIAKALRSLGVPVCTIVDFDALRDYVLLAKLIGSMGGQFDDAMRKQWNTIDAGLRGSEQKVTIRTVRKAFDEIIGNCGEDAELPAHLRPALSKLGAPSKGWDKAKALGIAAVPSGEATVAVNGLIDRLGENHLFVVPTGEVESFVPSVGNHGPKWVVEAVEARHLDGAHAARSFVRRVVGSFSTARRILIEPDLPR